MAITIFSISTIFALAIIKRKNISLISPYCIFISFQCLYNIVPYLMASRGFAAFPLTENKHLIDIQLLLSASANVCFALVYMLFYQRTLIEPPVRRWSLRARRNYLLLAVPIFVITLAASYFYGWNARQFAHAEAGGGMYTVASYLKEWFVGVYLYYLYRYGLDRGAYLLLAAQTVIVAIDGARTTYLPVVLLTLILYSHGERSQRNEKKMYAWAILAIAASVGARAAIVTGQSVLVKMTIPVVVEGVMGAYPSLQTIYIVSQQFYPHLTLGLTYIVDPIIWLGSSKLVNELSFLTTWEESSSMMLYNSFAPMGGFYYVAEAVAAFYYAGPAIVTAIYAGILVCVERNVNRWRLLYLAWVPTIGLLFVKTIFGNAFKLFVIELAVLCIYAIFGVTYRKFAKSAEGVSTSVSVWNGNRSE